MFLNQRTKNGNKILFALKTNNKGTNLRVITLTLL